MNARVAQELLKVLQRVGLEIGRILLQRHGQYGLDLDIKIQGRLDHQEVCPWRHADHHVHLRVGQIRLELGDKRRNGVLEAREFRGVEIPVTRYPHDEWGISLHVRSKLIQHGSRRYGSARQIVRPASRSAKTAASVGREFYRSAVRVASRRSTPFAVKLLLTRGRWAVARSATGPDNLDRSVANAIRQLQNRLSTETRNCPAESPLQGECRRFERVSTHQTKSATCSCPAKATPHRCGTQSPSTIARSRQHRLHEVYRPISDRLVSWPANPAAIYLGGALKEP